MYVGCVANLNWKLWTEKQQHCFGITGNVACVLIHAFALHSDTFFFFQQSFARNLKNISLIVWYCCNIRRPYKISNILYKTNEKAVSFLSTTSGTSCDLSRVPSFSWLHGVSLFRNAERCVVVSFSGATSVQWSDVEHALWAFSGVCWNYFQVFRRFGCAKWKYCEKWHLPAPKIWNPFFILSRVQREGFHYDKAISCKCYVQLLIQDVYSISSKTCQLYKCMLFVDCLVVLREYFVNWARVTKLQFFFWK